MPPNCVPFIEESSCGDWCGWALRLKLWPSGGDASPADLLLRSSSVAAVRKARGCFCFVLSVYPASARRNRNDSSQEQEQSAVRPEQRCQNVLERSQRTAKYEEGKEQRRLAARRGVEDQWNQCL